MSADNGIYILNTLNHNGCDEYRIAEIAAIDNLSYLDKEDYILNYLIDIFGKSEVFSSKEKALTEALKMDEEMNTEYGVNMLSGYEHFLIPRQDNRKERSHNSGDNRKTIQVMVEIIDDGIHPVGNTTKAIQMIKGVRRVVFTK